MVKIPQPAQTTLAGAQGYAEVARDLVEQYEGVAFEAVHETFLPHLPRVPAVILDVGAGSGRDAAALSRRDHTVFAVEPTAALRSTGQERHAGLGITWIDDALPELPATRATERTFAVLLLSAVWMHLDDAERRRGARTVVDLLQPSGRLMLSLREGPVPPGRRMFSVSAEETRALFAKAGMRTLICEEHRADVLGRPGVTWSRLVFQRALQG